MNKFDKSLNRLIILTILYDHSLIATGVQAIHIHHLEIHIDFVIRFANVNGSGSASANGMFAKALFRMGIPVATRNIFPSNIQGLPTWFEVRASEKGYLGRREGIDIMVAMNAETYEEDVASIVPGGFLLYDNSQGGDRRLNRNDINDLGIPLSKLVQSEFEDPKQRQLFKNIVYLGALSALLNIDFEIITGMVSEQYKGKDDLIKPNITAMELGRSYAHDYMKSPLPIQVRASDGVGDRILIDGNAAAALGAIYGGATICAWYPITPSTSMAEAFEQHASKLRVDSDTSRKNYAVIQAEDELAAMGIVIGAGWNGARAFTATSGPGVSLMTEFLGLAYFAEIPAVLFDVLGIHAHDFHRAIILAAGVSDGFVHAFIRVLQINVLADDADFNFVLRLDNAVDDRFPSAHIRGLGFDAQIFAGEFVHFFALQHQRHFVNGMFDIDFFNHGLDRNVAEKRNFLAQFVVCESLNFPFHCISRSGHHATHRGCPSPQNQAGTAQGGAGRFL